MGGRPGDPVAPSSAPGALMVCTPPLDIVGDNCVVSGDEAALAVDGENTATIDFGEAIVGRGERRAVRLISQGALAGRVTVPGRAFSAAELPTGSDVVVALEFDPPAAGEHAATLLIEGRGPNEPLVRVRLRGRGVADCTAMIDNFTAADQARPKLDVLFVIDDSPSMKIGQAGIRSQIQVFFERLTQLGLDFHVGITTTSMNIDWWAANLVTNADHTLKVVKPGVNAVSQFQEILARVGTGGSDSELGLLATLVALSPTDRAVGFDVSSGVSASWNGLGKRDPDFWRDDARLAVILVSDENDGGSPTTVEQRAVSAYVADLLTLKASPERNLRLVAIIDPGTTQRGCSTTAASGGAPRYHEAVAALGPSIAQALDYCSSFGTSLSVAAGFVATPECRFALTQGPMTRDEGATLCRGSGGCYVDNDWEYLAPSAAEPFGAILIGSGCPGPSESLVLSFSSCLRAVDADHDGVPDAQDNCAAAANEDQNDADADGLGDLCDL